MITDRDITDDPLQRDRMVIVADASRRAALFDNLRYRYRDWDFANCETYLAGIAEVSRGPVRVVLAHVDTHVNRLDDAVAGLRAAAGPDTKLILCCSPESEPVARRVVAAGADDYILDPLDGDELDAAIGYARAEVEPRRDLVAAPAASMEEFDQLAATLEGIGTSPMAVIENLAKLIRLALNARGATVIVQGAVATAGDVVTKPVLSAALSDSEGVIGQLTVAERMDGPYTANDVDKLSHYAVVAGHLLQAASKQRQWRELAYTDECSGLPNRRFLHTKLDDILSRAAAEQIQVTVLLFDIDDFKTYNDNYGHDAGDDIIRGIGELFRANCRERDIVTRYGGDEFAVVFWDPEGPRTAGSKHPDCALAVLDRFKDALHTQRFVKLTGATAAELTISGGLATYPWDGATAELLLKRADEALLAAKRAGKNRIFLIGE